MQIQFADSERSTLGVEWELAFVDKATRSLKGVAPTILNELSETPHAQYLSQELLLNTVEIVTGVHQRVGTAMQQISEVQDVLFREAAALDADVFCAGTHPFDRAIDQEVTSSERYTKLIERTQWWGRQMLIYGVHVHIGIDHREKVLPILSGLLTYYPHLQALSASSPWWTGELTGYASNRSMMFQQLPTAGLPFQFDDWGAFESYVDDQFATGVIDNLNEMRWDIRPAPKFGTIELRISDGVPTLTEVAALTALSQCLVDDLNQQVSDGTQLVTLPPWHVQENKWRAARYGLDADIIVNANNQEKPVREDLLDLVDRLMPTAKRLGCTDELAEVATVLRHGASYQRQLAVAEEHDGDLRAVVDHLCEETHRGTLSETGAP